MPTADCKNFRQNFLRISITLSINNMLFITWYLQDLWRNFDTTDSKYAFEQVYKLQTIQTSHQLWLIDTIWYHTFRSTLAQVMHWCLMASIHYLNQSWLTIQCLLWHSPKMIFLKEALINLICNKCLEITILKLLPHLPGFPLIIISKFIQLAVTSSNQWLTTGVS